MNGLSIALIIFASGVAFFLASVGFVIVFSMIAATREPKAGKEGREELEEKR